MTTGEAITYLSERDRKLQSLYRDSYPRFTQTDMVALSIVLRFVDNVGVQMAADFAGPMGPTEWPNHGPREDFVDGWQGMRDRAIEFMKEYKPV